jgi:hypothetical protein
VNELDQVTSKSCEERSAGHSESSTHQQRKAAAKHRIEAEYERQDDPNQIMDVNVRRRNELRETYSKLKDVLPVSDTRSSKHSLVERGERSLRYRCMLLTDNSSSQETYH